jgi:hypothetical protein
MIKDGGGHLPNGLPDNAATGWFESPEFTHLHGPWLALASRW